ncbi:MAG: hypothetical protein R3B41_02635 [Candidatus Doudnabacteria bacterium]
METPKISFKLSDIVSIIKKHLAVTLWILLIGVLIAESFIVQGAVAQYFSGTQGDITGTTQITRVDFNLYDSIEENIIKNQTYLPEFGNGKNPFGIPIREAVSN